MFKRAGLLILVLAGYSLYFWTTSRYPDLNAKALMAEQGTVADTIAAWPTFSVSVSDPTWKKIALTTANWIMDNRRGMIYGVITAALLFTIMSYLPLTRLRSRWWEKIIGVLIGTPLGLCVNCSAPVFKGMLRSQRLEMSFAAMFSSPTLNVIALTMVFSLFPFYMALTKVAFALFTIFVLIPLIRAKGGVGDYVKDIVTPPSAFIPPNTVPEGEGWGQAIVASTRDFFKNLWTLAIKTVPLMFVAGFLGAVLSHLIPFESFTAEANIFTIALTALIGVFLPVPMAFDIILTHALYQQGLPVGIVLTLLCTLGIFSVYSFSIVWTSASPRWAANIFGGLVVMGLLVGLIGQPLHNLFYVRGNVDEFVALRAKAKPAQSAPDTSVVPPPTHAPVLTLKPHAENAALQVARFPYQASTNQSGDKPFVKHEGAAWGLTQGFQYRITDYPDPFWIGRGTAAGDYNKDGWPDIVFGSETGFVLYKNVGGRFEKQDAGQDWIRKLNVYAVALVDLNSDGWQDLFFTTFRQGNFLILNNKGSFDFAKPLTIPNNKGVITVSPAFADLDRNGFLDIFNGNMALGVVTGSHEFHQGRESSIVYNMGTKFLEAPLEGGSGEAMSTLISDLNHDGLPDIYIGQDFVVPDRILLGKGPGKFSTINASEGLVKATPYFSMGADTGDFDNDGILDFLMTGTIANQRFVGKEPIDGVAPQTYTQGKWQASACDGIASEDTRAQCRVVRASQFLSDGHSARNVRVADCRQLGDEAAVQDCLVAAMWTLITRDDLSKDCDKQFASEPTLLEVCTVLKQRGGRYTPAQFQGAITQENKAFLYRGTDTGKLVDVNDGDASQSRFRHPGGWTWNARFVDLDGDGWLDIFNGEGAVRVNEYGWNVFLKNSEGKKFEQKQFSYNLVDDFSLFSFALADFDLDGDVDIIGNSSTGPVQIYENRSTGAHNKISFSLQNSHGNPDAIGAFIRITEKGGARRQMREIKASGGYQSFDAPVAYFGMGGTPSVSAIEVTWPDGAKESIEGDFAAGYHYVIKRKS